MGAAGAPEAHVPRRPPRREDRQGLLRVRRAGKTEDIVNDLRTDTAKASIWAALAGVCGLATLAFGPGFFPSWYFLLAAAAYGLILPVLAVLHVRHQAMRESGAVLATVAGTATVTVGIAASGNDALVIGALFVRAIWWWTIGKMWWETSLLPSWLALPTIGLGVIAFGTAIATAPMGVATQTIWVTERVILGVWLLALAYALWRIR